MNAPLRIRRRLLLAALLPLTLVALALAAVFLFGRLSDLDAAHQARARALARQLASASEYGIFAGNLDNLQSIAAGALREAEVHAVVILDRQGRVLAHAGDRGLPRPAPGATPVVPAGAQIDWFVQPVAATPVPLDDLYAGPPEAASAVLGYVQLALSHRALSQREREVLWIGLAVTLCGLLLAWLLAARLSQGVLRPILRISALIERIGRGDLAARVPEQPDDPLQDLHRGLNLMARRLQQGREELEERIASATRELRGKKEEAETATLAKSRFLAAASHDLRQPMHALGMFVSRLAQLPHGEEARRLVGYLEASVQAMQNLLDALLDISRLEAGAVMPQVSAFAVRDTLELLRAELEPQATQKGLRLRIAARDEDWVLSDPTLLHRILLNLVGNAVRYTRRGGVLVACRRVGGGARLRIEVWDTGIGIAPEHQQDVFSEFFQVANEQRDRRQGLGLGLNIVKRTAQLLEHPLTLCSVPGRGTRFCIEVPRSAARPPAPLAPPRAAVPADELAGCRVLVVEDDTLAAAALSELLASWGCVVRLAPGLTGALEHLSRGFVPDLLISDYRLGQQANGMEVLYRLRQVVGRPLPAFLVSGDTDTELIQRVQRTEFQLLHKPVRPAKLRSLMRHLLQAARRG